MSKARELQAVSDAKSLNHVAGCTCDEHRVEVRARLTPNVDPTLTRPAKTQVKVTLTVPQAQALVEAGEEWPDFTDMSGHQIRASKRAAKVLRTALLAAGRKPTWQ